MNHFLANIFSKLMGIFAAILLGVTVIAGLAAMANNFLYGVGILVFGSLGVILVFGVMAVILSQYQEIKLIRGMLQSISTRQEPTNPSPR
jgi:hypothetical protein